jgi:2-polyprenyl-6-methoxyphenol hydroxylase-like FAD-dependent oxidoreductase
MELASEFNGDGLTSGARLTDTTSAPPASEEHVIETDLLIVGTGPAGSALACFLASHGLKGIMLSNAPTTSDTPRAHITNPAALECMRDIGLEEACISAATHGDCMLHTRWCHDMTGEEYARIYSWGNDPKRRGDYENASPCRHVDLPQTEFEPILVRHAALKGWTTRFNTSFLTFSRDSKDGAITSTVRDDLSNHTYHIRSKYLFGCDGARSQVLRELKIPLIKKPGQGLALNVLVKVDLSAYVDARKGNLHWVFQPEQEYPDFAWSGLIRMVKPWTEWMFILFPKPGVEFQEPTHEQYLKRCKEIVGNDDLPLEILNVSKWNINEIIAEYYSDGNIFCLGDAVHRHPPFNGLGSNTCVQDAFNLAWKVAYTMKGLAGPGLLESYSQERQPVGHGVITRANQGIRDHTPVWDALGVSAETVQERMQIWEELKAATPEGVKRRKLLRKTVEGTSHEFHALGIEMNQRYVSNAVVHVDERKAGRHTPPTPEDPILEHIPSTFPGCRLPHAWLNTRDPGKQFSTIDLAGHGEFCILTGIGGEKWKEAAKIVGEKLKVKINAYSIGWCQDYEDVYGDWNEKSEIEESGCLLLRPDRFVAWRSLSVQDDCEGALMEVMEKVLGR